MNIHVRAIGRILKTITIPTIVGIAVGIMFNTLTANQIAISLSFGLVIFLFWLLYSWTLDQIKQEDQLTALSNKE